MQAQFSALLVDKLSVEKLNQHLRSGPGASSDVFGPAGSFFRLSDQNLTFSSEKVKAAYLAVVHCHPLTAFAEAVRCSLWGVYDTVSSTAVFVNVPKSDSEDRGICTQPSGNMALQLPTYSLLREALLDLGIDLKRVSRRPDQKNKKVRGECVQQELNRVLAQWGSRGPKHAEKRSWTFCTVDLSEASSRIPWRLVTILLLYCPEWTQWFDTIRSPSMKMPDKSVVEKHMCSTMGNGFTFPLMTLIFSTLVVALYELADLPLYDVDPITGERFKTWGVYGDDIIVDKSVVNALYGRLAAMGATVNVKKSFNTGFFRESCGGDFYDGYPVRPVFVETLQTQADIFSLLNRLTMWGFQHSVDLPRSLRLLHAAAKSNDEGDMRVPNWDDVSSGLHVPHFLRLPSIPVPKDFSKVQLDGWWFYHLRPKAITIPVVQTKWFKAPYCNVSFRYIRNYGALQYTNDRSPYCPLPEDPVRDSAVHYRKYAREITFKTENLPAVLLHTLGGSVRDGRVGYRQSGDTHYKKKEKYAPSWGDLSLFASTAVSPTGESTGFHVYALWGEYVRRNLFQRTTSLDDLRDPRVRASGFVRQLAGAPPKRPREIYSVARSVVIPPDASLECNDTSSILNDWKYSFLMNASLCGKQRYQALELFSA